MSLRLHSRPLDPIIDFSLSRLRAPVRWCGLEIYGLF
jgi:hypothetical protein